MTLLPKADVFIAFAAVILVGVVPLIIQNIGIWIGKRMGWIKP